MGLFLFLIHIVDMMLDARIKATKVTNSYFNDITKQENTMKIFLVP